MSKLKYKSNYLAFSVAWRNQQGTVLFKVHVTNIAIHTMYNLFFADHTVLFFQTKLFPLIYLYWQKYQSQMLAKVKSLQTGIVIAGDGRHDSMGHSAKFGAYTIFCCTVSKIIHFSLVQVRFFPSFNPCIGNIINIIITGTNYSSKNIRFPLSLDCKIRGSYKIKYS